MKFIYLLKKIKNKVMFKANKVNKKNQELLNIPEDQTKISFSKGEIAIILQIIKNSSFSGDMLETLYTLVYKLQEHYNKLK
tara:strand:+ start:267 stop:509 length:243 start_codon:yes stop_codon:yes gene_type:complete